MIEKKIQVKIIKQLSDNYSYVIYTNDIKKALIIDPAESIQIIKYLKKYNLKLDSLLITHHHSDHTSGIKDLLEFNKDKNINVYSPNISIFGTTKLIKDQEQINFGFINFLIISTPGHTLDHVVYYSKKEKLLFSGDTLFCYGCGRVFEGTMKQMLHSLKKIKELPDNTKVYCGHEYTKKNLDFIFEEVMYWKDSDLIKEKLTDMIKKLGSSMPFYLGDQKNWNPFLNCDDNNYKERVTNFQKNEGKISINANELEFFTFIRNKRNKF